MPRTYRDLTSEGILDILSAPNEAPKALAHRLNLSQSTIATVRQRHTGQDEAAVRAHVDQRRQYDRIWQIIFNEAKERGAGPSGEYTFSTKDQRRAQAAVGNTGNTYDLKYNLKGRGMLPAALQSEAPDGKAWHIHSISKGKYAFQLAPIGVDRIDPNPELSPIEIPNALPLLVEMHARRDEQALLARIRYNNLVGIFLGLSVYSLQSHWKTAIRGSGVPTEIDELYVGLDTKGNQFAICVEAKSRGHKEVISAAQIIGNHTAARQQFSTVPIISVAAKEMDEHTVAMLSFAVDTIAGSVTIEAERHYRIVK